MAKIRTKLLGGVVGLALSFGAVAIAITNQAKEVQAGTTTVTDILDLSLTGMSGTTYKGWDGKSSKSEAVYAGNSAGGNNSIQMRSTNNSGIITTTSGGKAKKFVITWNSNTAADRTVDIYGKNSAYSATSDLYSNDKKGTKIGSIKKGVSTELNISDDYEYIAFRSYSGALYLDKVEIIWEVTTTPEKEISSVTYEGSVSTQYYAGDTFDPAGLVFTVHYSDNTSEVIDVSEISWGSLVVGATSVKGTYEGFDFYVTVPEVREDSIISIEISGSLTKTKYYTTDSSWSAAGLVVTGTYESSASKTLDITNSVTWSYNPGAIAVSVTSLTVTANYGALSDSKSFDVTVKVKPAGTIDDPYDIETAIEACASAEQGVYARGIVSKIVTAYSSTHGNVSFDISEDGSTSSPQLRAYREKSSFSEGIKVGDEVLIYGNLTMYGSTPEFAQDCAVVKINSPETLSISYTGGKQKLGSHFEFTGSATVLWSMESTPRAIEASELSFDTDILSTLGTNVVTATYTPTDSRFSAISCEFNVEVDYADPTGISFDCADTIKLGIGKDIIISATVADVTLAEQKVSWSITSGADYIEIIDTDDTSVYFETVAAGTAVITATAGSISKSVTVIVSGEPSVRFVGTPNLEGKYVSDTSVSVQIELENFDNPSITWDIENKNVATFIEDPNHLSSIVSFVGEGTTSLSIVCYDGETYVDTLTLPISVTQDRVIVSASKTEFSYFVDDLDNIASYISVSTVGNPLDTSVVYESQDEDVVMVDTNGDVLAAGAGSTTIEVKGAFEFTNTVVLNVTVREDEVIGLTWSGVTADDFVGFSGDSLANVLSTMTVYPVYTSGKESSPLIYGDYDLYIGDRKVDDPAPTLLEGDDNKEVKVVYGDVESELKFTASVAKTINDATKPASGESGYQLVTNAADLSVGDKIVIAGVKDGSYVSAGDISNQVMSTVSSSLDDNNNLVPGAGAVELTLGKNGDYWTLSTESGAKLGATAVKKVAWDSGKTNWTITIDSNGAATIQNETESYGRFLYNASTPRFTTYTSNTSTSMLLPLIYKYVDASPVEYANKNVEAQKAALAFASRMEVALSEEGVCEEGDKSNLSTAWAAIKADFAKTYSELSDDAKPYFAGMFAYGSSVDAVSEGGDELQDALNRYDYVVANNLAVEDFLNSMEAVSRKAVKRITPTDGAGKITKTVTDNTIMIITICSATALLAISGYFFYRKRKLH